MKFLRGLKLLPHEWFFGAFLVLMWARLVSAAGFADPDALLYSGIIGVNVLIVGWCRRRETKPAWWSRLWFHAVVMNVVFMNMKSSVPKVMPWKFDGVLAGIDRAWFGRILSERMEVISSPALTEILSFCYLLFFPYLLLSWCYYTYRGIPMLRRLMVGLFTIYGLGFIGYSLVPAAGPHLAFPGNFSAPLTGWGIAKFNACVVAEGSNGVDVFPSLHCAVSCYLLFFDRRHSPWRFRLYLLPCAGIWVATIYLRYHYAADLIAGFALAAFGLWVAKKFSNQHSIP